MSGESIQHILPVKRRANILLPMSRLLEKSNIYLWMTVDLNMKVILTNSSTVFLEQFFCFVVSGVLVIDSAFFRFKTLRWQSAFCPQKLIQETYREQRGCCQNVFRRYDVCSFSSQHFVSLPLSFFYPRWTAVRFLEITLFFLEVFSLRGLSGYLACAKFRKKFCIVYHRNSEISEVS